MGRHRSSRRAAFGLVTLGLVVAATGVARSAEEQKPRSITVSGSGRVLSIPDTVELHFAVEHTAPKADDARNQAAATAKKVLEALTKAAGQGARVETSGFSLTPVYKPDPDPQPMRGVATPPEIVAYTAVHQIRVESRQIDATGSIIDDAIRTGAARMHGLSFTLADPAAAEDQALGLAGADAARQAKAVATALGVRLGPVLNATVEGGMQPKYDMRGRFATMSAEAMVDTPIQPGEVTTEARLQVVYGIE
jgi:uncharacterized protein YggE